MYTAHVAAPPPLTRAVCVAVCVQSWALFKHEQTSVRFNGIRVRGIALDGGRLATLEITEAIAPPTAKHYQGRPCTTNASAAPRG